MNIIFLLIPLSLVLLIAAVWAFFWAIRSGQFDDLDSPAWSVVMDDDRAPRQQAAKNDEASQDHTPNQGP